MKGGKQEVKFRAYVFSLQIIRFLDSLNKKDFTVQIISKQLLRSATSIGANIVEAQAGSSKKRFCKFFLLRIKISQRNKILDRAFT